MGSSSSAKGNLPNKIEGNSERGHVEIDVSNASHMTNSSNAASSTSQSSSASSPSPIRADNPNSSPRKDVIGRNAGLQLKTLTLHFTYLDTKIDQDFSSHETTFDKEDMCCMRVKLSDKESPNPIVLSRVLPYQARQRPEGTMKRYYLLNVSHEEIKNRDLYRMDVGIRKGPKHTLGRVNKVQNNQNG